MKKAKKFSVYIETSIPSYLGSRPSNDIRVCANQNITHDWWQNKKDFFDLYVSQLVLQEAEAGDPSAAERRLAYIVNLPLLEINTKVENLAKLLLQEGSLPAKAALDALHIAVATIHGIEYLLTWNCNHIANAIIRPKIEMACRKAGFEPPIICTPQELMEV